MAQARTKKKDEEDLRSRLEHRRGCPEDEERVEVYPSMIPQAPEKGRPAIESTVVRCIECGAEIVLVPEEYADGGVWAEE
jgi:hypothetical protein